MIRRWQLFGLGLALPSLALACTSNAKFATGDCPGGTCERGTGGTGGAGIGGGAGSAGSAGVGGGAGSAGGTGTSGGAGAGGGDYVELRVANFNVQNLFDPVDGGGFGEAELTPTPDEYVQQIDGTASVLALLKADVIVLEEVENRERVLADLADKLEEKLGVAYPSRWLITGNDAVRNVALIATLPVDSSDVISHNRDGNFDALGNLQPDGPFSFARDCLEVTVRPQGYPVTLFSIHYKSKSNDDPERRLAEARRTRQIVDAHFSADPNARLLVLGDFNDTPPSPALQSLTAPSPPLSSGVSLLPPLQAWTHPFGDNQLIDDQLASPALVSARRPETVTVWHDFDPGFPESLRSASDHAPVVITYRLGAAPPAP